MFKGESIESPSEYEKAFCISLRWDMEKRHFKKGSPYTIILLFSILDSNGRNSIAFWILFEELDC